MVELMIVIAVIAVLASIIMPKMGKTREKATLEACKQNIIKIEQAMEMYANENGGNYTPSLDPANRVNFTLSYLTPNYLKSVPTCPTGHIYYIAHNYPSAGRFCIYPILASGMTVWPHGSAYYPQWWSGRGF